MAGTLYVCATPIGNLDDMTFRVIKCLQSVDVIAAEDTRNSIKLLNHFEIKTPMTAYHEFNKYDKARALVQDMLAGKIQRAMIIGKGSLFLGRMTNLFDGVSFVIQRNSGAQEKSAGVSEEEVKGMIAKAMREFAATLLANAE